jgi:hypothetical protein
MIKRSLLLAGSVVLLTIGHASAANLKVDDDGVQCPGAPYTTLQAAVAAAAAGDRIKLCPGVYGGQVVVNVPLKIIGKAPKVKTCETLAAPDPTLHSIFDAPPVAGLGGIGIDVLADKVTIQGLVVRNAGEVGVRTDPANVGFKLRSSVFTQNVNGVYFHSAAGSKSTVKGNCFHQNGTGVRTGYGLRDASIVKNRFIGSNVGAAVILDQLSSATNDRVSIRENKSTADATFAVVLGTVDSALSKNDVTGDGTTGTAIFVGGNNTRLAITGNTVTTAGTRGIRFNTQFFPGFPPSGPSRSVIVTKNVIDRPGVHGIAIDSGAGEASLISSLIAKNQVIDSGQSGTGDGIRVEDPLAMGPNYGNRVEFNTITGSANHDCHDPSMVNQWESNAASTQSAANLCFTGAANGVAD